MLISLMDLNRNGTMMRFKSWLAPVFKYICIRIQCTVIVPFVALTALGDGVDGAEPSDSIIAVPVPVAPAHTSGTCLITSLIAESVLRSESEYSWILFTYLNLMDFEAR